MLVFGETCEGSYTVSSDTKSRLIGGGIEKSSGGSSGISNELTGTNFPELGGDRRVLITDVSVLVLKISWQDKVRAMI